MCVADDVPAHSKLVTLILRSVLGSLLVPETEPRQVLVFLPFTTQVSQRAGPCCFALWVVFRWIRMYLRSCGFESERISARCSSLNAVSLLIYRADVHIIHSGRCAGGVDAILLFLLREHDSVFKKMEKNDAERSLDFREQGHTSVTISDL